MDGSRRGRGPGTPISVLLAHGLPHDLVLRLSAAFQTAEAVAASLGHHQAQQCGDFGPQPCPWHQSRPYGSDLAAVTVAVNAWCATGWLERDLLRNGPDC